MIPIYPHTDTDSIIALRDALRAGGLTETGSGALDVPAIVTDILQRVQAHGDDALVELEAEIDKVNLTADALRVPEEQLASAHAAADPAFLSLVRNVAQNIREYQEHIRIDAPPMLQRGSRQLGVRYTPIDRVAVYVPGMNALYPSTVLMTVVPAQVAGVGEIVMCSPPLAGGDVDPMVLALAKELGVREVYRLGGAVAVAAMAFGSESIQSVQKIVGPGNAFVAEAKRQVFGQVGIDSIAGPSEVLIVADESAPPAWVAADLIAQAEHNPGSAVLVTTSATHADAVDAELDSQVAKLARADAITMALQNYSGIIVAPDLSAACEMANDFATEHLQIMTRDDDAVLAKIRHAGAIFVGPHTPVSLGDYYAGPSHVLPTGGGAKQFGPLSVNDFLKASSILRYDAGALAEDAPETIDFAKREGLTAHAAAVEIRCK